MPKIVLTADKTLMSEYNRHIFLGFTACSPKFIPSWLYSKIFLPPVQQDNGSVLYGHCGQRKIEAALINSGFDESDVAVVHPDKLKNAVDSDTKILCITTHDPLGLGPASTTFSDLGGKEPYTSFYFKKLINNPIIKKHDLRVLVGGSGAWQLTDERIMAKMGIDSVVVGEGEITAVKIINKILNNEPTPQIVEGEVVPLEQIPLIKKPTINGIVEICRGCGRGCRFCNPTMQNFRCQPIDYILKEIKLNVENDRGVLFHAEDVLRYKATRFLPNESETLNLFSETKKITDDIAISHFAHASVAAKPSLIEKLSEIMNAGSKTCPFISGQVGIETGSTRIVEKYMKGKAKPFKPNQWPEMIMQSHKILKDSKWVPAETLIVGLPGEKPEDVRKTIDLVHDLSDYKSVIVPLFFVPIGNLTGAGFFKSKDNKPEHWELIATSINHNFKWIYTLADENLKAIDMSSWKIWTIKKIIRYMQRKMNPYLKLMSEGINPREHQLT